MQRRAAHKITITAAIPSGPPRAAVAIGAALRAASPSTGPLTASLATSLATHLTILPFFISLLPTRLASRRSDAGAAGCWTETMVAPRTGPEAMAPRTGPEAMAPRTGPEAMAPRTGPEAMAPRTGPEAMAPRTGPEAMAPRTGPEAMAPRTGPEAMAPRTGPEAMSPCKRGLKAIVARQMVQCPRSGQLVAGTLDDAGKAGLSDGQAKDFTGKEIPVRSGFCPDSGSDTADTGFDSGFESTRGEQNRPEDGQAERDERDHHLTSVRTWRLGSTWRASRSSSGRYAVAASVSPNRLVRFRLRPTRHAVPTMIDGGTFHFPRFGPSRLSRLNPFSLPRRRAHFRASGYGR